MKWSRPVFGNRCPAWLSQRQTTARLHGPRPEADRAALLSKTTRGRRWVPGASRGQQGRGGQVVGRTEWSANDGVPVSRKAGAALSHGDPAGETRVFLTAGKQHPSSWAGFAQAAHSGYGDKMLWWHRFYLMRSWGRPHAGQVSRWTTQAEWTLTRWESEVSMRPVRLARGRNVPQLENLCENGAHGQ